MKRSFERWRECSDTRRRAERDLAVVALAVVAGARFAPRRAGAAWVAEECVAAAFVCVAARWLVLR